MKIRQITILFILILISNTVKADQLSAITKEQALKATQYLREQSTVILWCACCEGNNPKQVVTITNVYYESAGFENYFTVVLEGVDQNQKTIKEYLDLAYVHVNKSGTAYCVGKELGFACDPCTNPFPFTNQNTNSNDSINTLNAQVLVDTNVAAASNFTGTYMNAAGNIAEIKGPAADGAIEFSISGSNKEGYISAIDGIAYLTKSWLAIYYDNSEGSKCTLSFTFNEGTLEIIESDCEAYERGPFLGGLPPPRLGCIFFCLSDFSTP